MRKALGLSLFFLFSALPCGALAQEEPRRPPMVAATGTAEVFATPDRASIRLGVQEQAETAGAAQRGVNERMQRILGELRKLGVPQASIRTSRADLHPVYSYPQNRSGSPKLTGFRATNSVTVTLDLGKGPEVGPVIDAAVKAGANSIDGIAFSLSDDTAQRAQALDQAAKNARKKAESIASALGSKLGALVMASEGGVAHQPPRPMMRTMALESTGAAQDAAIEPGQLRLSATVEVRYALR